MILDHTVYGRYERDPAFRNLVDTLEMLIYQAQYTPTEIREAAMLALIRHEQRTIRPCFVTLRPLDGPL